MNKKVAQAVAARHETQDEILAAFGVDMVDNAHVQFCARCQNRGDDASKCKRDLVPLTLSGDRCPYFTP